MILIPCGYWIDVDELVRHRRTLSSYIENNFLAYKNYLMDVACIVTYFHFITCVIAFVLLYLVVLHYYFPL